MIYKFERKLKGANQVEATGEELTINNAGRKVQKFELSGRSEQKTRELSQKQASGEQVKLVDVDPNKFIDIFANGNSYQETTQGYNLCKSSSYNDSNLMLFFNPADITNKTITISLETNVELLGNSIYINSPIDAFHRLVAAISGRANERITSTFTLKDDDYAEIKNLREPRFLIYKDEAGFNEVINPQIVLGDIDKPYEPYTGGTPSPNPDYKQDVEVVDGCNRFDETEILKAEGWTKNSDGYYNGSFLKWNNAFDTKTSGFTIKGGFRVNTQYMLSFKGYVSGGTASFRIKYDDETFSNYLFSNTSEELHTIVSTAGKNVVGLYGTYTSGGDNTLYIKDVQFIEGTALKPYLPYGSIGLKQSGKNKFDNFKEYSYSNSNLNTTSLNNGIKIEKKGGFGLWVFDNLENLDEKIVRAKSKFNDGGSIAIGLASLDGTSRTVMKENTKSDTVSSFVIPKITDDKKYLAVWLYGTDNSEISYEDLIITIDNEDMTYEPYHEPKVIEINLNGNTLAKVGDVKDILKVNRNGEVEIEKNTWKDTINTSSLITLNNGNKGLVFATSKNKIESISDSDYLITNAQRNKTRNDGTVYQNPANFVLVGNSSDTLESIQAKFNGGEILYQLKTPQTIKLPSIEPIELWEGTVNIEIIGNLPADMDINYNILPAMPSSDAPSLIESIENNIKITICNKNIFNEFFTTNGVWKDDGTINYVIQSKLYWRTDFIKIPNKNIYFSSKQLNIFSSAILLEFDTDKKYITSNKIYQVNSNLNNVSLNESTRFIAIQWNLQNATEIEDLFTDFQIEVGPTASPYISHQEQTIIFPLAEGQKLRSLPNGIKDYLAEDGIHKNVGIIILNGSGGTNENYFKALDNKFALGVNTEKGLLLKNLKTDNLKISVLSDKFLGVPWNIMKDTIEGWQIALRQDESYTYLRLLTTGIKDTKALETFLQNNNAIVAYPLAEEEIIPYTQEQQEIYSQLQNLELFRGCNHITVESNVKPTIKLSYYDGELDMTDYKYNLQFKKHMQEM